MPREGHHWYPFFPIAPSAPINAMATAISSTSVNVTWTEPSMPNGIIRGYMITYDRFDEEMLQLNVSTVPTTALLTDLDIFTNYTIFVQAFTIVLGERSNLVTVQTNEDGK